MVQTILLMFTAGTLFTGQEIQVTELLKKNQGIVNMWEMCKHTSYKQKKHEDILV